MGEAGNDFGFNVGLNILPLLSSLWWTIWQKLFQVAGLDVGDDAAFWEGVIVVDDWRVLVSVS